VVTPRHSTKLNDSVVRIVANTPIANAVPDPRLLGATLFGSFLPTVGCFSKSMNLVTKRMSTQECKAVIYASKLCWQSSECAETGVYSVLPVTLHVPIPGLHLVLLASSPKLLFCTLEKAYLAFGCLKLHGSYR
jgi:hypothetical protein